MAGKQRATINFNLENDPMAKKVWDRLVEEGLVVPGERNKSSVGKFALWLMYEYFFGRQTSPAQQQQSGTALPPRPAEPPKQSQGPYWGPDDMGDDDMDDIEDMPGG